VGSAGSKNDHSMQRSEMAVIGEALLPVSASHVTVGSTAGD
jgi:hypothetical protein